MAHKTIFPKTRTCCVCGYTSGYATRDPEQLKRGIVAVSCTLYRRGKTKAELKAAGKVQICEPCFQKALASSNVIPNRELTRFTYAMRERLAARYSAMCEGDEE